MDKLTLKAVLVEAARTRIRTERGGRDNAYTATLLGSTAVSIDSGEISSRIQWAIHGTEVQISSDITGFIDAFVVEGYGMEARAEGHYILRNRSKQILAEARVESWASTKSQFYIRGKKREDVVKLFKLILADEILPEAEGGRSGLIRQLREAIASEQRKNAQKSDLVHIVRCDLAEQHATSDRLNRELGIQLDENLRVLGENSRLTDRVAELEAEVAELKKPKGFWHIFSNKFEVYRPQDA